MSLRIFRRYLYLSSGCLVCRVILVRLLEGSRVLLIGMCQFVVGAVIADGQTVTEIRPMIMILAFFVI
jgi:hypothetical protein